jgi:hypothetical protein
MVGLGQTIETKIGAIAGWIRNGVKHRSNLKLMKTYLIGLFRIGQIKMINWMILFRICISFGYVFLFKYIFEIYGSIKFN